MPGFTTHYILGMKAYNDLPACQLKSVISKYRWLYQVGLQGPDLFFYHIPFVWHRDHRNVGSYMHEHHVNDFFANALRDISCISSRQKREEALSFISGFMCHYVCDSICHPYVYGRINYIPNIRSSQNYGKHASLENDIDALLLMKYKGKKPSEFSQEATICLNGFETQFISSFLSGVINETYYPINYRNNFQVSPKVIAHSLIAMRFGSHALSDPSGMKKKHIGRVEGIFVRDLLVSQKIVTDESPDPVTYFNLNHEVWTNPWDRRLASTQSFPDLFGQCLIRCHNLFFLLNNEITDTKQMKESDFNRLLKEIGNYSYHSGLSLDK